MAVEFNHTIVHAQDRWAAARDVASVLGVAEPAAYGPFAVVSLGNGVTLDFMEGGQATGVESGQHYAFLVSETEFDEILGRLQEAGRQWWADPSGRRPGEINHADGGRGLYWKGPDHHWLEIITRPYGSGDQAP